jgi:Domain of unknown function (DUF4338)/DDE_Tnp_1-associated
MRLPFDPDAALPLGSFTVRVADDAAQRQQVAAWLEAEHFLGSFRPVGHSLAQIILEDGKPVALVQWAACAYHLKDREAWSGWDAQACARRRNLIINNVRFLVRAAARRPNLASKALAEALKAIGGQWRERFGYEPLVAETFTDPESHAGTCYKASGWTPLGLTGGNSRQRAEFYVPNERPKKLWVKPLRPDARERLCAAGLAPKHAAGETAGKGAPLPVTAGQLRPLLLALRAVPDPRRRNRFHPLAAMLCCVCVGLLCGADNLNAILRAAARLTQAQRRQLGLRRRRGSASIEIPGCETFRLLLARLDLDALGRVLSGWLGEHRGTLPAHLALDGKRIREHLGTIVTLCDIQEQVPVAVRATLEKGGEQSASRALLRSEQVHLLDSTVSLDALYANPENARLIVQEKGGDYLISLKDNQPTLAAHATTQLAGAPFLPAHPKCAAANSSSAS